MKRYDIINRFIEERGYTSYLEIGVQNGVNFNKIACKKKVGVDPDPESKATLKITSHEFFKYNTEMFDIIFIDGLHEWEQVLFDIDNAVHYLNHGGVVICHDMNPTTENMQMVPRVSKEWTGDCWKAWIVLRLNTPYLSMYVIDTDYGVGVIEWGNQNNLPEASMEYEDFDKNRKEWLNLITVDDFLNIKLG